MKAFRIAAFCGVIAFAGLAQTAQSQAPTAQGLTVSKGQGESVKIDLGYNIVLNKASSLAREWYVINDSSAPLQIQSGSAAPKYVPGRSRGEYRYSADYTLTTKDKAVRAYEIRFIVLDVFGDRQRVLSASVLADIPAQGQHGENGQWNLFSEADAATAFYSIAYVASVRTEDGQIYKINSDALLREVQKISKGITASDIAPEKPARPQ